MDCCKKPAADGWRAVACRAEPAEPMRPWLGRQATRAPICACADVCDSQVTSTYTHGFSSKERWARASRRRLCDQRRITDAAMLGAARSSGEPLFYCSTASGSVSVQPAMPCGRRELPSWRTTNVDDRFAG